jgi:hypothetical protein
MELHNSFPADEDMCHNYLSKVAEYCGNLKKFTVRNFLISPAFVTVVNMNKHLHNVDLARSTLPDSTFVDFLSLGDKLTSLNLSNQRHVTDSTFKLLSSCISMTTLNVEYCEQMTLDTILLILTESVFITDLNVNGCMNIIGDRLMVFISQNLSQMKALYMGNSGLIRADKLNVGITDAGITALCRGCRDLEILDVSNSKSLSIVGIKCIVEHLRKLHKVICFNLIQLNQNCLLSVMSIGFKEIEVLNLCKMKIEGKPNLDQSFVNEQLQSRLKDSTQSSSNSKHFDIFTMENIVVEHSRTLRKIDLTSMESDAANEVLSIIPLGLWKLQSLHLREAFSNVSLFPLQENGKNLTSVTITHCIQVSDVGIQALIDGCCLSLKYFRCFDCGLVTDVAVLYVGMKCAKTLCKFSMVYCDTEYCSVLTVVSNCKRLTFVEYTYNDPDDKVYVMDHLLFVPDTNLTRVICFRNTKM